MISPESTVARLFVFNSVDSDQISCTLIHFDLFKESEISMIILVECRVWYNELSPKFHKVAQMLSGGVGEMPNKVSGFKFYAWNLSV